MIGDQLIKELNAPSRVLAEEILRRFPAWMEFAEVYRGPDADPGSLAIRIPSPVPGRNHSLEVMVQGDTILTWYFIGDPRRPEERLFIFGPGEEREAAIEAVDWMADIVEERIVLIEERMGFPPWSRAMALYPISRDELTDQRKRRVISVSSWWGTFDEPGPARGGAG